MWVINRSSEFWDNFWYLTFFFFLKQNRENVYIFFVLLFIYLFLYKTKPNVFVMKDVLLSKTKVNFRLHYNHKLC